MLREFIPEPAYSTTDEDTVFALLSRRAERDPEDLIAQWQDDETRRWHDVTAGEMLERVRVRSRKAFLAWGSRPAIWWLSIRLPATNGESLILPAPRLER